MSFPQDVDGIQQQGGGLSQCGLRTQFWTGGQDGCHHSLKYVYMSN